MHMLDRSGPPLDALDALDVLLCEDRRHPDGRPWVSTDMVMSLDGAYSLAGRSGALSSREDHEIFIAHRSVADAILVGAATVRAERYRPPVVSRAAAQRRADAGQDEVPLVVITSRSLDLGVDPPLLEGATRPALLVHPTGSDTSRAPAGTELLAMGSGDVDIRGLLAALGARGITTIACEGGPALLGQLAAADLVDEYLVTLSPQLVGGSDVGLLGGAGIPARRFELHAVVRGEDHLMCSYRRQRS